MKLKARSKNYWVDRRIACCRIWRPDSSGIRDADMARSYELNQMALKVAKELLRPGGVLLVKSFISEDLQSYTADLKNHFTLVQRTKPEASRQGSSEFYFYANGYAAKTSAVVS